MPFYGRERQGGAEYGDERQAGRRAEGGREAGGVVSAESSQFINFPI